MKFQLWICSRYWPIISQFVSEGSLLANICILHKIGLLFFKATNNPILCNFFFICIAQDRIILCFKNRMKQYLAKLQEANFRVWLECISRVITVATWNYHQSIFYKEFKSGARISLALCQVELLQFGCHEVVKPCNKWISFTLRLQIKQQ